MYPCGAFKVCCPDRDFNTGKLLLIDSFPVDSHAIPCYPITMPYAKQGAGRGSRGVIFINSYQ